MEPLQRLLSELKLPWNAYVSLPTLSPLPPLARPVLMAGA